MNSKLVLIFTAFVYGIFGTMWFIVPDIMGKYWSIAPGENFTYMGHRYGAALVALGMIAWLARRLPNTQSRRVLMIGIFVGTTLTVACSLYGALGLGLNAWPAFVTEFLLLLAYVWVLFIKPEPLV
jgi:membrane-associated PAP2 superfamily phosphatase